MSDTRDSARNEADRGTADEALEFDPITNGVDFLASAISHLAESEKPRNLKYAVLHLQAAIEIFLKVRLQSEGIEHVFEDPYSVDEDKFRRGEFNSVTLHKAFTRLSKVAGVELSKDDRKALTYLSNERNKLQHFGSTSNRETVAVQAAKALNVLFKFIQQHLVPGAPDVEVEQLEDAEEWIRDGLRSIEAFIKVRLAEVAPELDAWQGIVIHCPDCRQVAWTFQPFDVSSRCRLCGHDWSQEDGCDVASEYAVAILDESRHEAAQGNSGWSLTDCPECESETLVGVATRDDPNSFLTSACFHCGFFTDGQLGSCGRCDRTTSDPDHVICTDCLEELAAED